MDVSGKIRAFLAIELDVSSQEYLAEMSSKLKTSQADVSWSRVSNAHLTLKFLGDINGESVIAIEKSLRGLLELQPPFEICLTGAGVFPNLERPRVVWVGIEDKSGMLKTLANSIEKAFENLGFSGENRAFHPHITLGRVRSVSGKLALANAILNNSRSRGPCLQVTGATLFRSDLRPSGAIHTPLLRFGFDESRS